MAGETGFYQQIEGGSAESSAAVFAFNVEVSYEDNTLCIVEMILPSLIHGIADGHACLQRTDRRTSDDLRSSAGTDRDIGRVTSFP